MIEQIIAGFQAMSYWEYIAVLLGLAYIVLAMKQSLWCWPAAFASTSIFTILFWQGFLYMESLLNFYYLIMAVFGWWQWRGSAKTKPNSPGETLIDQGGQLEKAERPIQSWQLDTHAKWIAAGTMTALILGFSLDTYTQAKMAYLDSFTSVFAVLATYMVTQKVLENWLYWVVIDLASIYLYTQNQYYPTAVLFALYTVLAAQGYRTWRQQYLSRG